MAAGFCLPHKYRVDGFCHNNRVGISNSIDHDKFPGDKGGSSESCEIFKNGVSYEFESEFDLIENL